MLFTRVFFKLITILKVEIREGPVLIMRDVPIGPSSQQRLRTYNKNVSCALSLVDFDQTTAHESIVHKVFDNRLTDEVDVLDDRDKSPDDYDGDGDQDQAFSLEWNSKKQAQAAAPSGASISAAAAAATDHRGHQHKELLKPAGAPSSQKHSGDDSLKGSDEETSSSSSSVPSPWKLQSFQFFVSFVCAVSVAAAILAPSLLQF